MTDRNSLVIEQLEREWRELGSAIRPERMEELYMQVSAAIAKAPAGAEITDAERQEALALHDQTDQDFKAAIQGLSEAQWMFRPAPNRWSIQEVAEHITLVATIIGGSVEQSLAQAPEPGAEEQEGAFEGMRLRVLDRSSRGIQAPPPVVPTGQWSIDETVRRFEEARAREREMLLRPGAPLKARFHTGMPGTYNCYHWLQLVSLHTRRHLAQILEVKTTAGGEGYPA